MSPRLELLESLSLPGDAARPKRGQFFAHPKRCGVFDGTTGLGELLIARPERLRNGLRQFGARRFRAHAESGDGGIRDWLRAAAADAEKSYRALRKREPVENYEVRLCIGGAGDARCRWLARSVVRLTAPLCCATVRANSPFSATSWTSAKANALRVVRLAKPGGRGPAAAGVREEFSSRAARFAQQREYAWRRLAVSRPMLLAPTMQRRRASRRWRIHPFSWQATASSLWRAIMGAIHRRLC